MTYVEAVRLFKTEIAPELFEKHVDYWTGEERWAIFVDSLCKSGSITERQYNEWTTPFPYGKRL